MLSEGEHAFVTMPWSNEIGVVDSRAFIPDPAGGSTLRLNRDFGKLVRKILSKVGSLITSRRRTRATCLRDDREQPHCRRGFVVSSNSMSSGQLPKLTA